MIISITVTYQPDLTALRRQILSVREQLQHMLVIDNGSSDHTLDGLRALCNDTDISLHTLDSNTGIAYAQNIGIKTALNLGADMLLLLDQDSEAMPGMVSALRRALEMNPKAAAAGPRIVDSHIGHRFSYRLELAQGLWRKLLKSAPNDSSSPMEVATLISSGTLIRAIALDSNEPMLANWFIDHIDSEWCFRTRAAGWVLLGVPNAQLRHQLGDKVTCIWFFGWRPIAHHSPLRDYYMFRNTLLLTRKSYVYWYWKLYLLARLIMFAGFFLIFTPKRLLRLKMMTQGIFDGIFGRTGQWT